MALPSTGQITMSAIQGEFDGGVNPIALTEYYRGGPTGYVDAGTLAGTGSCAQISTSGQIQMCMFRGVQDTIVGDTGLVTAPFGNNEYRDYVLPASVQYLRFFILGAGGGGGGYDANGRNGGNGGAGSFVTSTINTSFAGPTNVDRILRVWVGKAGGGGRSNASGNSVARPAAISGNSCIMVRRSHDNGDANAFVNTYGVAASYRYDTNTDYEGTFTMSRTIDFPTTGSYTFILASDNHSWIEVDGVDVVNTQGLNNTSTNSDETFRTSVGQVQRSATVTAGLHKVSFIYQNTANRAVLAARILKPDTSELFNTRQAYGQYGWPVGGHGGYSGSDGNSGYGGAGGSGTFFSIIHPVNGESRVACAGGGGGGGGAAKDYGPNNRTHANFMTQGISLTITNPNFVSGQEGEYVNDPNQNRGYMQPGNANQFFEVDDGGGGGGGGGGIANSRIFVDGVWSGAGDAKLYSGMGGKTRWVDYVYVGSDADGDGGEAGKSWVNGNAPRYADFVFAPSTTQTPRLTGNIPVSFAGYGAGGNGATSTLAATTGTDGCAYFDWGITNTSVGSVPITYHSVIASVYPSAIGLTTSIADAVVSQVFDAWGGGGRPGEGYTYSWSYISGDAVSILAPNNYRTNIEIPGVNGLTPSRTGVIRCTVTDSLGNVGIKDAQWSLTYYDPYSGGGG